MNTDLPQAIVTQADRDAVQAFHRTMLDRLMSDVKSQRPKLGDDEGDAGTLVQAFARHRLTAINATEARKDTVAFVQEWMMSGDHEPDQWHREFAAAIDARRAFTDDDLHALAERFCSTPLPETVAADLVALKQMPGRTGTNLMTGAEAKEFLRAVLAEAQEGEWRPGTCILCAGKCRGHGLADPVAWEPEVGSVAALARAKVAAA